LGWFGGIYLLSGEIYAVRVTELPADDGAERAARALADSGIDHTITRHGRVSSLEEAAAARGVRPAAVIKTMVVRRGKGDYLFVLVHGDREISWPKLRTHLGVNRLSMPDADKAREVTGYVRGTITPFGATTAWPVVADATMTGHDISIGGGAPGVAATAYADDVIRALGAQVADVTDPIA
jgi:Cys-tRNA(Pro) deacylase